MFGKIVFGTSLFFSVLAFADTVENKDAEAVSVVCTGENCPEDVAQAAPVDVVEQPAETK